MPPDRRGYRDGRVSFGGKCQVWRTGLLASLFMAENAVLCLKDESSALDVSFLIEISLCKKVGHEVAHVAGPKNWKIASRTTMHVRRVIPHGSDVACKDVRTGPLEQIDLSLR